MIVKTRRFTIDIHIDGFKADLTKILFRILRLFCFYLNFLPLNADVKVQMQKRHVIFCCLRRRVLKKKVLTETVFHRFSMRCEASTIIKACSRYSRLIGLCRRNPDNIYENVFSIKNFRRPFVWHS